MKINSPLVWWPGVFNARLGLIVSANPIFDASDTIFTFNPSGSNGAGLHSRES
jgi:hypothetical protein